MRGQGGVVNTDIYLQPTNYQGVGANAIQRDLNQMGQGVANAFTVEIENRKRQVEFANRVLENLDTLKGEGQLAHQKMIADKVDEVHNGLSEELFKFKTNRRGKKKFVGFNINDPDLRHSIREKIQPIKNAIIRSNQMTQAYDQAIRAGVDPNNFVTDQQGYIEDVDKLYRNADVLFNNPQALSGNIEESFRKILQARTNPNELAKATTLGHLSEDKMDKASVRLKSGEGMDINYNPKYWEPVKEGEAVTGVNLRKESFEELVEKVKQQRPDIVTDGIARAEAMALIQPQRGQLFQEPQDPKPIKPTEAETKRAITRSNFKDNLEVLYEVGTNLEKNGKLSKSDRTIFNTLFANKDIKLLSPDDLKKMATEHQEDAFWLSMVMPPQASEEGLSAEEIELRRSKIDANTKRNEMLRYAEEGGYMVYDTSGDQKKLEPLNTTRQMFDLYQKFNGIPKDMSAKDVQEEIDSYDFGVVARDKEAQKKRFAKYNN